MDGQLAAPFHFAAEFLILAVCAGAVADALGRIGRGGGVWAALRAAGFTSLVAAQVVHGALVVEGDGELTVIVLRAIGFGLLALSVKPRPAEGMPALFFASSDARWAVLPAFFAIVASGRLLAARRGSRETASLALAGSFALFAGGEAALAASDPAGGLALATSHAARAAGALLLARWLWSSFARSVRLRFVAVFVAALVLLATVIGGALTQVIGSNLEDEELQRLQVVAATQQRALEDRIQLAVQQTNTLANLLGGDTVDYLELLKQERIAEAFFVGGGRALLLPSDADFLAFLNSKGRVVRSAREVAGTPQAPNPTYPSLSPVEQIALQGSGVVRQAITSSPVAGDVISIDLRKIAVVGAAAVRQRGKTLGMIVIGFDVDRDLLSRLSAAEANLTILKGGEVVSSTYDNPLVAAGLSSGQLRTDVRRIVEEAGGTLRTTASPGGERSFTVYVPILSDDGTQVVGVLAASRPAVVLADAQRSINQTLFLITLVASAIAAAMAWLLSGRVTRPIRALTRAARQVRGGDLEVRATVDQPDEVGTLGEAFNEMAQSLKRMTDDLRGAADEEANLRARMEAIMQSMGDALVATDTAGTVVAFNRAAERMIARAADDVVGRRLTEVLKGSIDADGRSLAESVLGGNGIGITAAVEASDGRSVPVAVTGAPLRDSSGETVGRVVVLRDTSREHEAERMKTEFLANVSHELRTPLTPIKGYTEILRRKQFPRQKAQAFLDGIMESTKRLERIVEILVDFAAMEAGRLKPRLEPVDLRAFLGGVADAWKDRSSHRIVRRVPAGLPPVLGDERLLRKCLDELFDNAIKFSPGGGDIEIEAELAMVAGKRRPTGVRISIRDRGIGIEAAQMGSLFQDFRQLDGSETRPFGGLGLGLSYARRVALAHHGEITATSEAGRGSTFTLTLPVAPAAVRGVPRRAETRSSKASGRRTSPRTDPKDRAPAGRRAVKRAAPKAESPSVIRKKVAAAKVPPRRRGTR